MGLNWGDVPSWIGVVLTIAIPLIAYMQRNRIAVFFQRKATEPLPALPPARFTLRPGPRSSWVLTNASKAEVFNVRVDVEDASAAVVSSGFWERFLESSYATVNIQLSHATRFYGGDIASTYVVVSWEDAHSVAHSQRIALVEREQYKEASGFKFQVTEPGKVLPLEFAYKVSQEDPASQ